MLVKMASLCHSRIRWAEPPDASGNNRDTVLQDYHTVPVSPWSGNAPPAVLAITERSEDRTLDASQREQWSFPEFLRRVATEGSVDASQIPPLGRLLHQVNLETMVGNRQAAVMPAMRPQPPALVSNGMAVAASVPSPETPNAIARRASRRVIESLLASAPGTSIERTSNLDQNRFIDSLASSGAYAQTLGTQARHTDCTPTRKAGSSPNLTVIWSTYPLTGASQN